MRVKKDVLFVNDLFEVEFEVDPEEAAEAAEEAEEAEEEEEEEAEKEAKEERGDH